MDLPGGDFDGAYTLTLDPLYTVEGWESCCWTGTISKTVTIWSCTDDCGSTEGCGGSPPASSNTITSFDILLCIYTDDGGITHNWYFEIVGGSSGYVTQLFVANPEAATDNCAVNDELPTFTNDCNGVCGLGTFYAGNGGTAVISFEDGTDTFVVGCEGCPNDCTGCANLTATISGLTGNCACANGAYTLTRSDCVWEYMGETADADPFSVISIDYRCVDGNWTLTVDCLSTCAGGTPTYSGDFSGTASQDSQAGDECGRLATYNVTSVGATYCTGSCTVVIS